MRTIFLLFLLITSVIFAEEQPNQTELSMPLADAEVGSSLIIGGFVNVLTGSYVGSHCDMNIPSSEPLAFSRNYACKRNLLTGLHAGWWHCYTSQARSEFVESPISVYWQSWFIAPNGATTYFDKNNKSKNRNFAKLRYDKRPNNLFGLTNIGRGFISGQTNLKNTLAICDVNEKKYQVKLGNGHQYILNEIQRIIPAKEREQYRFIIDQEIKPNGNIISYRYSGSQKLQEVISQNASQNLTFASFKFKRTTKKDRPIVEIEGNDGRKIHYEFTKKDLKITKFYVKSVTSPEEPKEEYEYIKNTNKDCCLISTIRHPQDRYVAFEYSTEDDEKDKIKAIKAPAGKNGSEVTLYKFSYRLPSKAHAEGKTTVRDSLGNRTEYRFDQELHITSITRQLASTATYSKERFYWGKKDSNDEGNLISHGIEDGNQKMRFCRAYKYDNSGNVLEEQIWGNLTGTNDTPITIQDGYPQNNGAECYRVLREYSVDGFNLLLKEVEPNGKTTHFQYKPNTNLLTAKFVSGSGMSIREFIFYDDLTTTPTKKIVDNGTTPDPNNLTHVTQRLITVIKPNLVGGGVGLPKEIEEYYLDLSTKREVLLNRTVLAYDAFGHVIQKDLYDSNNSLQLSNFFAFDTKGKLTKERNSVGQSTEYAYDENGNRILTRKDGIETHDHYDLVNRLIRSDECHPDGSKYTKLFTYDPLGNVLSSTDIFGHETHFQYDEFGRCISLQHPQTFDEWGNAYFPKEAFTYDIFGKLSSQTDPKGYTTTYNHTVSGKVTETKFPDGTIEKNEYTLKGELAKKFEKNGTYTTYTYDAFGNVLQTKTYSVQHQLLSQTSCTYDSFHLLSKTNANGSVTLYTYDGAGRKTSETQLCPEGQDTLTQYGYDTLSRLHTTTKCFDDKAVIQVVENDSLNRVIEERTEDQSGTILEKKQYVYDSRGNRIKTINYQELSKPLVTETTFDGHNQPITILDPMGQKTVYSYNYHHFNHHKQRVLQKTTTDSKGVRTVETYDVRSKVVLRESYNAHGTLLTREAIGHDKNANETYWKESIVLKGKEQAVIVNIKDLGPLNRLEKLIEAFGAPEQKVTKYLYNTCGQLETVVKPSGISLDSIYDEQGRLAEYRSSDGSISYKYEYDKENNPIVVSDLIHNTKTLRSYDALNRVVSEKLGNGLCFTFSYDSLGRRSSVKLPDDTLVRYSYDALHLREVSREGKKSYAHQYQKYNLTGDLLEQHFAGVVGGEIRSYDAFGRRTATTTNHWKETHLQYDSQGNLTQLLLEDQEGKTPFQFGYDDLNQLIQENGHQYQFDSLGNCVDKDGLQRRHNALNQIVTISEAQYVYDKNGNLIEQRVGGTVVKYQYDAIDRLIAVTQDQVMQTKYAYDSFHRRISKECFVWNENKWTPTQKRHFLYVNEDEIGSSIDGKMQELRVLGEGLGAEIGSSVAIETLEGIFIPIHNARGDICCLVNMETGQPTQTYRYTAFGETSSSNTWGFASKRYDAESGFVYFGRRYYAPHLGRWITPDPNGYGDGPNLYAYVHNNPLVNIDLYGLFVEWDEMSCFDWSTGKYKFFDDTYMDSIFGLNSNGVNYCDRFERSFYNFPQSFREGVGLWKNEALGIGAIFGIGCNVKDFYDALDYTSSLASGGYVYAVYNPTHFFYFDLYECCLGLSGTATRPVLELHQMWNEFFKKNKTGKFLQICHSQGVIHVKNALIGYPKHLRERILVVAIAPATYISKSLCADVVHYRAALWRDPVPYINFIGAWQERHTTVTLRSHPKARLHDHDFQSPTYINFLMKHIDEYFRSGGNKF